MGGKEKKHGTDRFWLIFSCHPREKTKQLDVEGSTPANDPKTCNCIWEEMNYYLV